MARKIRVLNAASAALAGSLFFASLELASFGQSTAPASPPSTGGNTASGSPASGFPRNNSKRAAQMSPEMENVQRALEGLTPDQLKRFQENFLRWSNLPPEEKKALRGQDEFRRKQMVEDIETAMHEAGLELTKEKRQEFIKRYIQERRKIEETLRKEMEEKRRPLLKEMRERLRQEFTAPGAPAGNAQP